MAWLNAEDRDFLQTLSDLSYCNPFLPVRLELERRALGNGYDDSESVWSRHEDLSGERINVERIGERVQPLADRLRGELMDDAHVAPNELILYEDLIQYLLYYRYRNQLKEIIDRAQGDKRPALPARFWEEFDREYANYLAIPQCKKPVGDGSAHMLACFFQLRRAFHHIFHFIVGRSMPAAQLRAAVWHSIFTHDMRRYRRMLFDRMGDFTTLIAGASGTGKELVARAIGLSRYIPLDERKTEFKEDFADSFHALNLSALSPTLIESELFGHCRGAFTGAVANRQGWLEICTSMGTVFLDEIGELDATIQVKLLRVLQSRQFQRLGESADQFFQGKIIAATNRDLAAEIRVGRFRQDFYYRLCSDIITTPTLRDQLADAPEDLHNLVIFIARRVVGDDAEAVADEVESWIRHNLGPDYAWPGNIRELEQCVRNVLIRQMYVPPEVPQNGQNADPSRDMIDAVKTGSLTADQLLRWYCTLSYARLGSYEQTAKQLGLDRRTVKAKIDQDLLDQIKSL